jgi:signal transduction histidine kinase
MNQSINTVLLSSKAKINHATKNWNTILFPNFINAPYGNKRMTTIVLRGTLLLTLTLAILLIINGLIVGEIQYVRLTISALIAVYLILAEIFILHRKFLTAAWMLVVLYSSIATLVLLVWSLNASIGILTIGFTIFLAGVLLGTKYISIVTVGTILILCTIQSIHSLNLVTPDLGALSKQSHFIDVVAYSTMVGIFALISWLAGKQTEHSIQRAMRAEKKIKAEKIKLVRKLKEQSIALRQAQLQEMSNLYKFASIGQSTIATLHELSNQLSVLSLDIDDLQLRHSQSKAIQNAKEGIENINLLIRQTRKQLHDNEELVYFNAMPIIDRALTEIQPKFISKNVTIHKHVPKRKSFIVLGDPLNLSHVITILLNNASDACISKNNSIIKFVVRESANNLYVSVTDNGRGLSQNTHNLFQPHKSTKPNGLGIGLYITKQIIENQFKGKISVKKLPVGTEFILSLPKHIL